MTSTPTSTRRSFSFPLELQIEPRMDSPRWLAPLVSLWYSFREVQKYYAVFGACFMPLLALVLLYLNGRRALVGKPLLT